MPWSLYERYERICYDRKTELIAFRNLNAISPLTLASVLAAAAIASAALADDVVHTRSPEAAYADLIRDWNYNGGGTPGVVHQRTSADRYADLVRDWNGPSKAIIAVEKNKRPIPAPRNSGTTPGRNWCDSAFAANQIATANDKG